MLEHKESTPCNTARYQGMQLQRVNKAEQNVLLRSPGGPASYARRPGINLSLPLQATAVLPHNNGGAGGQLEVDLLGREGKGGGEVWRT